MLPAVLQDGSQLHLSEADRKALVFGLALHEKGKASLEAGQVQVQQLQLLQASILPEAVLQAYFQKAPHTEIRKRLRLLDCDCDCAELHHAGLCWFAIADCT